MILWVNLPYPNLLQGLRWSQIGFIISWPWYPKQKLGFIELWCYIPLRSPCRYLSCIYIYIYTYISYIYIYTQLISVTHVILSNLGISKCFSRSICTWLCDLSKTWWIPIFRSRRAALCVLAKCSEHPDCYVLVRDTTYIHYKSL